MTYPHHRHATGEPVRSYSFDLREIVAVIPREMFSGVPPACSRLTLQLPPEALDSTGHYLTTSLGTIWRACPVLFAQPVSAASDRMVVLARPGEGVVTPFRIASPLQLPGSALIRERAVANAISRPVAGPVPARSGVSYPYLQETTHIGSPMPAPPPPALPPVAEVPQPGQEQLMDGDGTGLQERASGQAGAEGGDGGAAKLEGPDPFLVALREGKAPPEPLPAAGGVGASAEAATAPDGSLVFSLRELFGDWSEESLPFDPSQVSPDWKVYFPAEFILRQMPSGRVTATLAEILECVAREAREALAGFAGNEVQVTIPLREIFERLPRSPKLESPQPESGLGTPEIFVEKGAAGLPEEKEQEAVFPGRFGPRQSELEPVMPPLPPSEDLADAPEYAGDFLPEAGGEEEVASLDELEAAPTRAERASFASPDRLGARELKGSGAEDGLSSRQVPDFAGLGFAAGPVADLELRAIFATHEVFTPQRVVERTAGLDGVEGAVLFCRNGEVLASALPAEEAARRLGRQAPSIFSRIQDLAGDLGFAGSEVFTLHTGSRIVSFFGHAGTCLAVLHGEQLFGPGTREKLMLIARGAASLLREREAA